SPAGAVTCLLLSTFLLKRGDLGEEFARIDDGNHGLGGRAAYAQERRVGLHVPSTSSRGIEAAWSLAAVSSRSAWRRRLARSRRTRNATALIPRAAAAWLGVRSS